MVRCDVVFLLVAVLERAHAGDAGPPAAGVAPDEDYSDAFLDSYQLIEKYGFRAERHLAVTRDGYELTLFRIPGADAGGAGGAGDAGAPPVLLLHGVSDSSDCWLLLGRRSLALRLAAAGRDVWLLNARGNRYSRGHARRPPPPPRDYWDFSFEEVGTEDLAAAVDLVLAAARRPRLHYVGFSQGTTAFLALCSLRPEYNERVARAVLLAPVAWMTGVEYPYAPLLAPHLPALARALDALGVHELFPWNPAMNALHAGACREGRASKALCDLEYLAFFGVRSPRAVARLAVVAAHVPAGASRGAFEHYLQVYAADRFMRRDRGRAGNLARYGRAAPPDYELGRVAAPVVLLGSADDWFSSAPALRRLQRALPRVDRALVLNQSLHFTHLEFVYGARVHLVNDVVLEELRPTDV
ncbi:hypothetical protein JYU34_006998 [Plutella xylostella]|uniref:Lipase n=1 Tax=Plutella xylostella TaxID=51655 RepID=A0ABQ7QTD5_PLUXY|nr:hypothetical protein JYU34_006998 [Plutella xylostella]